MLAINISACIAPPPSSPAASRSRYLRFAASRFRHIHRSPATPLIILLTAAQTLSPGCAKVTTPLATSADFDSLPILRHAILWTSSHYGADLCVFYLIPHLIDVPALATMHARRGVTSQSTAPFPATSCPGTDIAASDTSGVPGAPSSDPVRGSLPFDHNREFDVLEVPVQIRSTTPCTSPTPPPTYSLHPSHAGRDAISPPRRAPDSPLLCHTAIFTLVGVVSAPYIYKIRSSPTANLGRHAILQDPFSRQGPVLLDVSAGPLIPLRLAYHSRAPSTIIFTDRVLAVLD
ncbi:hypothetical protein C8J57DRAFT_1727207 [Mycena rebaudengoi]|nr:hypothetical protein C8J57DRAFT_1727207 [Mycena rebaudengoi]